MLLDTNHQNAIIQPRPYHRSSPAHFARHHQAPYYSQTAPATPFYADDLDYDADHGAQSLTSSPLSQISLLSAPQTSPLSTFDSIPAARGSLFDFPPQRGLSDLPDAALFANPAMMTDTWLSTQQFSATPRSRMSHQRESSLSSLGSNSPASPYSQNISHPHVVNDSPSDAYHGLPSDDFNYQLSKSYATPITHDQLYTAYPAYTSAAEHSAMANPRITVTNPKRKAGQTLLRPEHMIGSRPVSVASSIVSDSPATPAEQPEEQRRRRVITENSFMREIPKLERTATDAYADELYSDHFTNNFSATASQVPVSPSNSLFADRIQAMNQQHLSAVQSPVSTASANKSPFMKGSPLAQMPVHDFQTGFSSQQQFREQKVSRDVQAAQQQMAHQAGAPTPQTISPRDALLEYSANDTDANFPLFPPTNNGFDMDAITKAVTQAQQDYTPLALDQPFNNFLPNSHLSSGIQVPQQYPFIPQRQQSSVPSLTNGSLATSRMGSAEAGSSDSSNVTMPQRPAVTSADGGTYTCTYHGCTMRFDTPVLLQKHKREGHRQAHGLGATRRPEAMVPGLPGGLYNTQHGPHKCDRINPSTGKPCNTVFSRPYDLTRHEDTIHNARKQKVRCDLCTDEKTFSRADALTRHYRVCHPEVEFPGKQRRRGGHTQ